MPRYVYTQESGADFKVNSTDKADAYEDSNEVRQILDDLGELLGHSKFDDAYPADATEGGTLSVIDDLKAVNNYTDSPMIVTGGEITVGTDAGTFKVAALTTLLRATDSPTGVLTYKTLAVQDNQAITAADTFYYIVLNYASTPTISLSASMPNNTTNIHIGFVMKNAANKVHFISGGLRLQDGVAKLHKRAKTLRQVQLNGGSAIAYSGTNNFTMAIGYAFGGINEFEMAAYNSATTQFTYVYDDGSHSAWTEALSYVIDFAHYDDGDGTLGDVGVAKFGTHWVYRHVDDGDVYVVYGKGNYSLAAAEAADEPTRPAHLTDFGCLIGKIIAPYGGDLFTVIQMANITAFAGTAVSNHANLSNLDYAAAGHTGFAPISGKLSQFAATTSAELAGIISDETGSGLLVFGTSPAITTPTGIVVGDIAGAAAMNFYNALSVDHSYSSKDVDSQPVGENVVFGQLLYFNWTDVEWKLAKADAFATTPALRIALETKGNGETCLMLVKGWIRDDSAFDFGAARVFLSAATAGAATSTVPATATNQIQMVGIAKSADILFFDPSQDVGER